MFCIAVRKGAARLEQALSGAECGMSGPAPPHVLANQRGAAAEPNQPGGLFGLATLETNPMPSRSNTAPKKRATGIRNEPCFPTLFFAREGRLLARPPHARTPPYKVHPRAALPTVELETKILGPLRGLKVCAKIQGVRFVYVGSLGQEPNWVRPADP
jgi:hypothetical protein